MHTYKGVNGRAAQVAKRAKKLAFSPGSPPGRISLSIYLNRVLVASSIGRVLEPTGEVWCSRGGHRSCLINNVLVT